MGSISWWRSWHGAPTDHKWPVIAARSGVKVGVVSAIAWALLDYASQHKDRGSIEGFDTEEYAIYSGFSEEEIKAVMQAMSDKKIIVDGHFTNWEKRQPKREDDSRDRVRKFREVKRNVTHGNAPEEEEESDKDTESDTDTDKDKDTEEEREAVTQPLDPFDDLQRTAESAGILLTGEKDVEAISELLTIGATPADLKAGIKWKAANNNGKPIRYFSQVVGPTKTALAIRLQNGNGASPPTPHVPKTVTIVLPDGTITEATV